MSLSSTCYLGDCYHVYMRASLVATFTYVMCMQALTFDSRSVEALSLKGLALMEVKKTPEAISHFREALRLAPYRFEAYNSMSCCQ